MQVQPNCVYVIPPNADLAILHGKLQVLEPVAPRGLRTPIDFFFRHLAADQKDKAIGIILSGMGSDGTLGVRAIKEQLGMAMVQDPASAKYDGMPRSAIGTGMVDYVAAAEELPARLIQYAGHLPAVAEKRDLGRGRTVQRIGKGVRASPRPQRERFLLLQEDHHRPADRASHGHPPVRQLAALCPLPPGEPAGSRVAPQGTADRRDRLLPRPGDVRLSQGKGRPPVARRRGRRTAPCGSGIPVARPARKPTRWPSCSWSAWRG